MAETTAALCSRIAEGQRTVRMVKMASQISARKASWSPRIRCSTLQTCVSYAKWPTTFVGGISYGKPRSAFVNERRDAKNFNVKTPKDSARAPREHSWRLTLASMVSWRSFSRPAVEAGVLTFAGFLPTMEALCSPHPCFARFS